MSGILDPERQKQLMDGFLETVGLSPRPCERCGQVFTPPPYMKCRDFVTCPDCAQALMVKLVSSWRADSKRDAY